MTGKIDKARAVFLATLMVVSVFGGTMAFAGTAAATANELTLTSSGPYQQSDSISFEFTPDNTSTDVQIWIDSNGDGQYQTNETNRTINASALDANSTYSGTISVSVDAADGTDYQLSASQNATLTEGLGADSTSGKFEVDGTAPRISSAATADTDQDGRVDEISVTLTEPVNDSTLDPSAFEVTGANVDGVSTGNADDAKVHVSVSGLGINTSVTPQVNLTTDSLEDAAGNSLESEQPFTNTSDGASPQVVEIHPPENGSYSAGDTLDFGVDYSEPINSSSAAGTPTVSLSVNGSPTLTADYVSSVSSSGSQLNFTYAIQDGQSGDISITPDMNVALEGVVISDESGNEATTTLTEGFTATWTIDAAAAQPVSIEQPTDRVNKTTSDTLDVTYSYSDDNPSNVQIILNSTSATDANEFVYDVDDSNYSDSNHAKTVTLDLDDFNTSTSDSGVSDLNGSYAVKVVVTDALGNENSTQTGSEVVFVDDKVPDFGGLSGYDENDASTSFNVSIDNNGLVHVDPSTIEINATDSEGTEHNLTTDDQGVTYFPGEGKVEVSGLTFADGTVTVEASAADHLGNANETTLTFEVNDAAPNITSVEAEAGSKSVDVTFSEPVYANDSAISADDFAYEDNSGDGAGQIVAVTETSENDQTITLELDSDVSVNDLGSDTVSVRAGAINDSQGSQVDTSTVELGDTTAPAKPVVTVSNVTAENEGSYGVQVTADTASTVHVTVKNSSGDVFAENNSVDISSGAATVGFDLTGLEEGDVTVEAVVSDRGVDLTNSTSVSTVKDNTSATMDVQADAGTYALKVTFSETVEGADKVENYDFENLSATGIYQQNSQTYWVQLENAVEPDDLNEENVTVSATENITDVVGTAANTSEVQLSDDIEPRIVSATAEPDSENVTVQFSERVYNDSDGALSADNVTYVTENNVAHEVESVSHEAGATTATVTLTLDLSGDEIASDDGLKLNFTDSQDNEATNAFVDIEDDVQISDVRLKNTSDGEVQVYFNSTEKLNNFTAMLENENDLAKGKNVDETFHVEDAEPVEESGDTYTYKVNYHLSRDGSYNLELTSVESVSGTQKHVGATDSVDTDYQNASVVDAHVSGADADSTEISLFFSEPVTFDEDEIRNEEGAVTLDGANLSVQNVVSSDTGKLVIEVAGNVATGDAPQISVDNAHFSESTGALDAGVANSETTLDTHEFDLKKGVNFVSVPAEFGSLDIASSGFADMTIMTYDHGEWHVYDPEKSAENQDFATLEGGQGFIVKTDSDATVDVTVHNEQSGSDAASATPGEQPLEEGWNLVGHWQEGTQDADQQAGGALDSISAESTATNIYGQKTDGEFSYETVTDFRPGEAYWVFVEDDEVYAAANY